MSMWVYTGIYLMGDRLRQRFQEYLPHRLADVTHHVMSLSAKRQALFGRGT